LIDPVVDVLLQHPAALLGYELGLSIPVLADLARRK
jgi:hypothetical protein